MTIAITLDNQPPTPAAELARSVVERWGSAALVSHCLRSAAFALDLGHSSGLAFDEELLFCAAMLHDLGVTPAFDAESVPFEDAGGAAAWVFAAGAGWDTHRRDRMREIVQRHAWAEVDPAADPESYLLEAATSLDVAGSRPELWSRSVLLAVPARYPRSAFADEFDRAIAHQAAAKPRSEAARFHALNGVRQGEQFWADLLRD